MYELKVVSEFAAAHKLRGYDGECEKLHGHNWRVEAIVVADTLDSVGLAVDFKDLKQWLNGILDDLDHLYLNELEPFQSENPSSENLARFIFCELQERVAVYAGGSEGRGIAVQKVTVWESERAAASYYETSE
ncbi:MAG: 6-carboxytetrahydropterin synthase QueD [Deltaproteobacteria bacterium]|nr:6-carboxytetrahydropterin synthase QueD [Deltaproteobacteria bacterium]